MEHPSPGVTLVHTRLAILDLTENGHQPMADRPPDGLLPNWIVYNGEVFNFRDLQGSLAQAGWSCRTRSDTEVILHSYRVWRENCVQRFRGMFAFCLLDRERGLAHLFRDRLGIKPLYLYRPPQGGLIFASEIRAILALGPEYIAPRVGARALESFLAQGAVQGYETLIDGIEILQPGTRLTIEAATAEEIGRQTYWQLPLQAEERIGRAEAVERLGALGREAVRLRLISDVPLGLFLSGGIDSAAVLSLASQNNSADLRTISVGFDSADFDESGDAADTAAAFGAHHTTLKVTGEDALAALPDLFRAMDQPSVDGMNTYIVSRAARRAGLTVALSGLGGDELFGGYASFTDAPRALAWRRRFGLGRLGRLLSSLLRTRSGAKLAEAFRRPADLLMMYLLRRELFLPAERRALLPDLPRGSCEFTGLNEDCLADLRKRSSPLEPVNQISLFEIELYMRHMLLRDGDVFSMAAAIEYRVPFLDHRLVEAVFSMPADWKRADPRPKPLLLDAVGSNLPSGIWQKPKRGFTFPWVVWFARGGVLAATAQDAAHDAATWRQLGIRPSAVAEIWRRFTAGDRRISPFQMLALVTLRDYAGRHRLQAA
jgi:asparagine synthase (glutamine-hydrolysing)